MKAVLETSAKPFIHRSRANAILSVRLRVCAPLGGSCMSRGIHLTIHLEEHHRTR